VKIVEDGATRARTLTVPKESYRIPLKQENIDFIKDAMVGVTSEPGATAYRAFTNAGYTVGGKTGTAQVVAIKANEKYNVNTLAERLRDNALFTAFAPADKPRIAIAMVVENAGFGGAVAAPIARKVLDYYLLGKLPAKDTTKVPKEDAEVFEPVEEPVDEEAAAIASEQKRAADTPAAGGAAAGAVAKPAGAADAAKAPLPLQNPPLIQQPPVMTKAAPRKHTAAVPPGAAPTSQQPALPPPAPPAQPRKKE
jgi:penicillin-binding protein 2